MNRATSEKYSLSTWLYREGLPGREWFTGEADLIEDHVFAAMLRSLDLGPSANILAIVRGNEHYALLDGTVLSAEPKSISGSTRAFHHSDLRQAESPMVHWMYQAIEGHENLVHALKAPVSRIRGITKILKASEGWQGEDELLEYLDHSSERLRHLVDQILNLGPWQSMSAMEDAILKQLIVPATGQESRFFDVGVQRIFACILQSIGHAKTEGVKFTTELVDGEMEWCMRLEDPSLTVSSMGNLTEDRMKQLASMLPLTENAWMCLCCEAGVLQTRVLMAGWRIPGGGTSFDQAQVEKTIESLIE